MQGNVCGVGVGVKVGVGWNVEKGSVCVFVL